MTREQLNAICTAIKALKKRSDRLTTIRTKIEQLRDAAVLQTTKALYQAVLDLFDED